MNQEEFKEYLKNRYCDQIKWYDEKATYNEKMHKSLETIVIILAVITPILLVLDVCRYEWLRWVACGLSGIVAMVASLVRALKYHENWINYRTTCKTLRKEIHYYDAKLYDYRDAEDPEALFVERVEALISRENTLWLVSQKPQQ